MERLIELYHPQNDGVIADLFAGCGTTLVEAKAQGYASIGTDINPIAILITRVKTRPIQPERLLNEYNAFVEKFADYKSEAFIEFHTHKCMYIHQLRQRFIAFFGKIGVPAIPSSLRYFNLDMQS